MTIKISQETAARLNNEARRQGISVDTLLARLIERGAMLSRPTTLPPELPVWHLGGAGSLLRRDIYSDDR